MKRTPRWIVTSAALAIGGCQTVDEQVPTRIADSVLRQPDGKPVGSFVLFQNGAELTSSLYLWGLEPGRKIARILAGYNCAEPDPIAMARQLDSEEAQARELPDVPIGALGEGTMSASLTARTGELLETGGVILVYDPVESGQASRPYLACGDVRAR